MMTIQHFDIDDFLQHYWQQKPLLIRNAFPDFDNPLSPEELAGMACEPEIESRLIKEENKQWSLQHGPIEESVFTSLDDQDWTLLVQAVDHWVPEVAELLNRFRFIPNWRIDDVMVSYATKGGSVGPHYDNYDVFLLQGAGQRHWQLGPQYSHKSPMQDNQQLRLLADFKAEQEWTLNPGDMLYVPPGFGHWGTSLDNDCMTYSIGFRAPGHSEILSDFCDHQMSFMEENQRYSDPHLQRQAFPGEITEDTIEKVQAILMQCLEDKAMIKNWFGNFMTIPKYDPGPGLTPDSINVEQQLKQQVTVYRNSSARFAYSQHLDNYTIHINGLDFNVPEHTAKRLANDDLYDASDITLLLSDPQSSNLINQLFHQGILYFEYEEDDDSDD